MITKRTLERWRREALLDLHPQITLKEGNTDLNVIVSRLSEIGERILRLTRELLDAELIRK